MTISAQDTPANFTPVIPGSQPDPQILMVSNDLEMRVDCFFQNVKRQIQEGESPSTITQSNIAGFGKIYQRVHWLNKAGALSDTQEKLFVKVNDVRKALKYKKGILETRDENQSYLFFEKENRWLSLRLKDSDLNTFEGVDKRLYNVETRAGETPKCVMAWRVMNDMEPEKELLRIDLNLFNEVSSKADSTVLPSLETHAQAKFSKHEESLMIMPFLEEKTIEYIRSVDSHEKFVHLCLKAISPLNSIHREGVLHGDYCLNNLIFDPEGKVHVIDLIGSINRERYRAADSSHQNDLSTMMRDLINHYSSKFENESPEWIYLDTLSYFINDLEFMLGEERQASLSKRRKRMAELAPQVAPILRDFTEFTSKFFEQVASIQEGERVYNFVPTLCQGLTTIAKKQTLRNRQEQRKQALAAQQQARVPVVAQEGEEVVEMDAAGAASKNTPAKRNKSSEERPKGEPQELVSQEIPGEAVKKARF